MESEEQLRGRVEETLERCEERRVRMEETARERPEALSGSLKRLQFLEEKITEQEEKELRKTYS